MGGLTFMTVNRKNPLREPESQRKEGQAVTTNNQALAAAVTSDPRWAAVVARDARAEGTFFYSVKSTGVYCRPSCRARLARPENVRFHLTRTDAERAGFRPCKRCRPDQPPVAERQGGASRRAVPIHREQRGDADLDELASRARLSVFHLHRLFKAVIGVTPRAYAAAHRMRRVRAELVTGRTRHRGRSTVRDTTRTGAFTRRRIRCWA